MSSGAIRPLLPPSFPMGRVGTNRRAIKLWSQQFLLFHDFLVILFIILMSDPLGVPPDGYYVRRGLTTYMRPNLAC